jgi:hypothetical protein
VVCVQSARHPRAAAPDGREEFEGLYAELVEAGSVPLYEDPEEAFVNGAARSDLGGFSAASEGAFTVGVFSEGAGAGASNELSGADLELGYSQRVLLRLATLGNETWRFDAGHAPVHNGGESGCTSGDRSRT